MRDRELGIAGHTGWSNCLSPSLLSKPDGGLSLITNFLLHHRLGHRKHWRPPMAFPVSFLLVLTLALQGRVGPHSKNLMRTVPFPRHMPLRAEAAFGRGRTGRVLEPAVTEWRHTQRPVHCEQKPRGNHKPYVCRLSSFPAPHLSLNQWRSGAPSSGPPSFLNVRFPWASSPLIALLRFPPILHMLLTRVSLRYGVAHQLNRPPQIILPFFPPFFFFFFFQ